MQTIGDREPLHGELGRFYDAIENPRKTRGELPILRGDELRAYLAEVRERTLEVLDEVDLDVRRPAAARRLRLRDAARPRAPAQRDDAAAAADGRRLRARSSASPSRPSSASDGPEMVPVEGGEVRDRRPGPAASPTTTSAPATRVERRAPSGSTAPRSPTAPMPSSSPTPAPSRRCTGSATATAAGLTTDVRRPRARSTRAARSSTSPGTRPTPSRAGPASGCRPSSSGRPRPPGADRERANLDQLALRLRSGRRLRRRAERLRRRADARRRLGMDGVRLRRPTRASRPSPTPSTPRSSSAPSTRCCAAAPGRPAAA